MARRRRFGSTAISPFELSTGTIEGDKELRNRVSPKTIRAREKEKTERFKVSQQAQTALDTARIAERGGLARTLAGAETAAGGALAVKQAGITADIGTAEKALTGKKELLGLREEAAQGLTTRRLAGDLLLSGQATGDVASNIYSTSPGFDPDFGEVAEPMQRFGFTSGKFEQGLFGEGPQEVSPAGFYTTTGREPTFQALRRATDTGQATKQQIEDEIRRKKAGARAF